jgi:hypothetical protein
LPLFNSNLSAHRIWWLGRLLFTLLMFSSFHISHIPELTSIGI